MGLLKKCPICGKEADTTWPCFMYQTGTQKWVLSHYCEIDGEHTGSVTVFGETAEEVFERWNHRIEEKG